MDEFKKAAMLRAAFESAKRRDLVHVEVPTLDDVVAAYLDDEIDWFELDGLVEAAVFGRAVELSPALHRRRYMARQKQVRFTDVSIRQKYRTALRGVD